MASMRGQGIGGKSGGNAMMQHEAGAGPPEGAAAAGPPEELFLRDLADHGVRTSKQGFIMKGIMFPEGPLNGQSILGLFL